MDRIEELCRAMCRADGTEAGRWSSKRALAEAAIQVFNGWAPYLRPTMRGCLACRTALVIASPGSLGRCDACGAPMVVLPG